MTKSLIPCWKAGRSHLCKHLCRAQQTHLLQTARFQLQVCKGKGENHRAVGKGTEQRLSSLLFPSAPWAWKRVPLTKRGKHHSHPVISQLLDGFALSSEQTNHVQFQQKTHSCSPESSDSHGRELRANSEIHHFLQPPFFRAHSDAQAIPEAIQLDFSSASLVLSHALLELCSCSCMQLIKTAVLLVDERKDEMTMLVLHFFLHALPNFCSSGSQDPKM